MIRKEILYWIPLSLFLLFCLYRSASFSLHDFGNYYFGSYFLAKGEFTPSIYDPLTFNQKIAAAGYHDLYLSYAPNPPFSSLLFLPFIVTDAPLAKLAFNLISILAFVISLVRLGNHLKIPAQYVGVTPLVFALPIYTNILFGQVYFIVFALLSEGYLSWRTNRLLLCSILWGVAIVFKITPAILLLFLFFRKEYKLFTLTSLVCVLLLTLSITVNGWSIWQFYIAEVLPKGNNGEATAAALTINYQSGYMLLKYLFLPDAIDNPSPIINSPVIFQISAFLFKVAILALAAFYSAGTKSAFASWALWIVAGVLISPYGSNYSSIVLLLPVLAFYSQRKRLVSLLLLVLVLINLPISYLYDLPLFLQFPRLLLTGIIFFITIRSCTFFHNRKFLAALTLLSILIAALSLHFPTRDQSSYLLNEYNHPLVMDYTIEGGVLTYSYWTKDGIEKEPTDIEATSLSSQHMQIANNQILYQGNVVTAEDGNKTKPSLLNDSTLIFLSDKGRGYGFYAFRKLPLHPIK